MNNGHVIICGFGHLGYRSFQLLSRLGRSATIIYDSAPGDWLREAASAGYVCLQGDARDNRLLEEAGIRDASAVIIATDNDLTNLSIAVDTRALNPSITIVLRLFDQALAPHLKNLLSVNYVLSTSALAAPVLSSGALDGSVIGFFEHHKSYYVVEECPHGAARADAARAVRLFEGSGSPQTSSSLDALVLRQVHVERSSKPFVTRQASWLARLCRSLSASLVTIPRQVKLLLAGLVVMVGFSVFFLRQQLHLSLLDSLYLVTAIITTIGFGDLNFTTASDSVKLYGCILMLCGAVLMATVISLIANVFVTARLGTFLTMQSLPEKDHHIVLGLGRVGLRLVEALRALGEDVTVIDSDDESAFASGLKRTTLVVSGDGRSPELLHRAGVLRARSIIAVTDDDVTNIGAAIVARDINPRIRTVLRVFDSGLGEKLEKQLSLGRVLSVSAVAAPTFVAAALYPCVISAFVAENRLLIVTDGSAPPPDRENSSHRSVALSIRGDGLPCCPTVLAGPDAKPENEEIRITVIPLATLL